MFFVLFYILFSTESASTIYNFTQNNRIKENKSFIPLQNRFVEVNDGEIYKSDNFEAEYLSENNNKNKIGFLKHDFYNKINYFNARLRANEIKRNSISDTAKPFFNNSQNVNSSKILENFLKENKRYDINKKDSKKQNYLSPPSKKVPVSTKCSGKSDNTSCYKISSNLVKNIQIEKINEELISRNKKNDESESLGKKDALKDAVSSNVFFNLKDQKKISSIDREQNTISNFRDKNIENIEQIAKIEVQSSKLCMDEINTSPNSRIKNNDTCLILEARDFNSKNIDMKKEKIYEMPSNEHRKSLYEEISKKTGDKNFAGKNFVCRNAEIFCTSEKKNENVYVSQFDNLYSMQNVSVDSGVDKNLFEQGNFENKMLYQNALNNLLHELSSIFEKLISEMNCEAFEDFILDISFKNDKTIIFILRPETNEKIIEITQKNEKSINFLYQINLATKEFVPRKFGVERNHKIKEKIKKNMIQTPIKNITVNLSENIYTQKNLYEVSLKMSNNVKKIIANQKSPMHTLTSVKHNEDFNHNQKDSISQITSPIYDVPKNTIPLQTNKIRENISISEKSVSSDAEYQSYTKSNMRKIVYIKNERNSNVVIYDIPGNNKKIPEEKKTIFSSSSNISGFNNDMDIKKLILENPRLNFGSFQENVNSFGKLNNENFYKLINPVSLLNQDQFDYNILINEKNDDTMFINESDNRKKHINDSNFSTYKRIQILGCDKNIAVSQNFDVDNDIHCNKINNNCLLKRKNKIYNKNKIQILEDVQLIENLKLNVKDLIRSNENIEMLCSPILLNEKKNLSVEENSNDYKGLVNIHENDSKRDSSNKSIKSLIGDSKKVHNQEICKMRKKPCYHGNYIEKNCDVGKHNAKIASNCNYYENLNDGITLLDNDTYNIYEDIEMNYDNTNSIQVNVFNTESSENDYEEIDVVRSDYYSAKNSIGTNEVYGFLSDENQELNYNRTSTMQRTSKNKLNTYFNTLTLKRKKISSLKKSEKKDPVIKSKKKSFFYVGLSNKSQLFKQDVYEFKTTCVSENFNEKNIIKKKRYSLIHFPDKNCWNNNSNVKLIDMKEENTAILKKLTLDTRSTKTNKKNSAWYVDSSTEKQGIGLNRKIRRNDHDAISLFSTKINKNISSSVFKVVNPSPFSKNSTLSWNWDEDKKNKQDKALQYINKFQIFEKIIIKFLTDSKIIYEWQIQHFKTKIERTQEVNTKNLCFYAFIN